MATKTGAWIIHARHIIRKSRSDPGKVGVWFVPAPTADRAVAAWRATEEAGMWEFESVLPCTAPRRVL